MTSRYDVEKLLKFKRKDFVCRIRIDGSSHLVSFSDENIFHTFVFFVQTQTKLLDELEGATKSYLLNIFLLLAPSQQTVFIVEECFVVRPDNSQCHHLIGARGNMCLLYICEFGAILALQVHTLTSISPLCSQCQFRF